MPKMPNFPKMKKNNSLSPVPMRTIPMNTESPIVGEIKTASLNDIEEV
jgi:hypothetical protein